MPHDPRKLLHDMLDSCQFVSEFSSGRTLNDLRNDRAFRSCVERELQIVGEALISLTRIAPELSSQIGECNRIVRFRHVLVHGYDVIDCEILWTIVSEKVPVLIHEVSRLLRHTG